MPLNAELTPVAQPVPDRVRRTRGTSRAFTRHRQRLPRARAVRRTPRGCAPRVPSPGTRPGSRVLAAVKPGPGRGLSLVSASRAARGAHRHATTTSAGHGPATARARRADRHRADDPPAARAGRRRARRADHRLAARPLRDPGRGSGQTASPSRPDSPPTRARSPRQDHVSHVMTHAPLRQSQGHPARQHRLAGRTPPPARARSVFQCVVRCVYQSAGLLRTEPPARANQQDNGPVTLPVVSQTEPPSGVQSQLMRRGRRTACRPHRSGEGAGMPDWACRDGGQYRARRPPAARRTARPWRAHPRWVGCQAVPGHRAAQRATCRAART